MKALIVYGYKPKEKEKTGMTKIRCLFQNLYPSPGCIANAKRTVRIPRQCRVSVCATIC